METLKDFNDFVAGSKSNQNIAESNKNPDPGILTIEFKFSNQNDFENLVSAIKNIVKNNTIVYQEDLKLEDISTQIKDDIGIDSLKLGYLDDLKLTHIIRGIKKEIEFEIKEKKYDIFIKSFTLKVKTKTEKSTFVTTRSF